jgi:hypothetical protein
MFNKIRLHTAKTKALWFKAQDCAKILGVKTCNLTARKNVHSRAFKLDSKCPVRYISEPSFRLIFAKDKLMLAELDRYLTTGEIDLSDKYSELLFVAQLYLMNQPVDPLELPGLKPIRKAHLSACINEPPVVAALLKLYLRAVFYNTPDQTAKLENVGPYLIAGRIFSKFPVKFPLKYLYEIHQSGVVPIDLIELLTKAEPQTLKYKITLPQGISATDFAEVLKVTTKPLTDNYFNYPITCETFEPIVESAIFWDGT